MTQTERLYRIWGTMASAIPVMVLTVVVVLLLGVQSVAASALIGIAVGLIGGGAGAAIGSELYARRHGGCS